MKHHLGSRTWLMSGLSVMSTGDPSPWDPLTPNTTTAVPSVPLWAIHWRAALDVPCGSCSIWNVLWFCNPPTRCPSSTVGRIQLRIHPHQAPPTWDPSLQNSHWEKDPSTGIKPSRPQWQPSSSLPLYLRLILKPTQPQPSLGASHNPQPCSSRIPWDPSASSPDHFVWEFQQSASTWQCCRKELNLPGCVCHPTASALPAWGTKPLIQVEIKVRFYSKPYLHTVIVYSNGVHNTLILKSTTF